MNIQARVLVGTLIVVIASGTVFFHYVEKWSWIDSYFFTVVTLSTVGYGNLVPVTEIGKIAATVYIISGLGVFAIAIRVLGEVTFHKRFEKLKEQERRKHKH